MDNYNIRQDRPKLSSDEIAQQKDFDGLLNDFHIMKKPFYKNPWFFGVTGMATVGLLFGTTYSFTNDPAVLPQLSEVTESAPPEQKPKKTIYLASLETPRESVTHPIENLKKTSLKKKQIHDKTSTLKPINESKPLVENKQEIEKKSIPKASIIEAAKTESNAALQNHPRINGRIGGQLSISSLEKGTTLSTDSNIPIAGFEMHLATEFGAKIYRSTDSQLTFEMIEAIQSVAQNSEVYFEQIKGKISAEGQINLPPLKYTLIY